MADLRAVEEFPSERANVVGSLRRLADGIEAGTYGPIRFAAVLIVGDRDGLTMFGYGKVSDLEMAGALARGGYLAACCIRDLEHGTGEEDAPEAG